MPKNSAPRLKLVADTEQEHIMCKCIANKHFKQSCIAVNYRHLKSAPLFDLKKKKYYYDQSTKKMKSNDIRCLWVVCVLLNKHAHLWTMCEKCNQNAKTESGDIHSLFISLL